MKRILIASLFVAACGPKAKGAAAPSDGGFHTAPEYAALFEKDRSWTFTVKTEDDEPDEESESGFKAVSDSHETTCKVTDTGSFDGGITSQIECDDLQTSGIDDPLSGLWVADATGVYHLHGDSVPEGNEKPTYDKESLIFEVPPKARDDKQMDPEYSEEEPVSEISVGQNGEAWCYSWSVTQGDGAWVQMCVGMDGPVNGSFGWSGGSSHEADFELKK